MIINNIGILSDGFKLKFYLYEHVYNRRCAMVLKK